MSQANTAQTSAAQATPTFAWVIEVETPWGWKKVGHLYRERAAARSWISFVKAAWHAKHARTVRVKLGRKP